MKSGMLKLVVGIVMFGMVAPVFAEGTQTRHRRIKKPGQGIERRVNKQEKRIREGVESGKLTKDQAAKLEQNVQAVKTEEQADLQAGGGKLTKEQRQKMKGELDANSKEIYQEKHPGKTAPNPSPAK